MPPCHYLGAHTHTSAGARGKILGDQWGVRGPDESLVGHEGTVRDLLNPVESRRVGWG